MRPRRSRTLAALLAAGLAVAGCASSSKDSTDKFKGEARSVAQVVEDLQDAGRRGNADRICEDLLAKAVIQRLAAQSTSRRDCGATLDDALDDADIFDLSVEKVDVRGARATAVVKSDAGNKDRTDTLTLVKEGRNWKLAEIR